MSMMVDRMQMSEEAYAQHLIAKAKTNPHEAVYRGTGTPEQNTKDMPEIKLDEGKLRYDLLPPLALDSLVKVYTYGCQKYAPRQWEGGMSWSRVFAALMRHCWNWFRGENVDQESGLPHMAHAAWGCIALLEYGLRGRGEDDRPYPNLAGKLCGSDKEK